MLLTPDSVSKLVDPRAPPKQNTEGIGGLIDTIEVVSTKALECCTKCSHRNPGRAVDKRDASVMRDLQHLSAV